MSHTNELKKIMNKEFKRLYFIDFVEHFQKFLMKRHLGFISAFELRGDEHSECYIQARTIFSIFFRLVQLLWSA